MFTRSLAAASLVAAVSVPALLGQTRAGGSPISALPYKQVEWPIQMASAAGPPLPWNFIQASSVAVLCPLVVNRTISWIDQGHISETYGLELATPFRNAFRRELFR